jgi:Xaa-Pro aminopeptidase
MAAFKIMRPGLWEYQVAAKMVEVHAMGGSEAEAYAPIVGAGPNSTALHYDNLGRKIQDGDIVVMDVGAQYSGYAADITRTVPANGKFTPRQREIYEIVLGAQNAALAALKPGMEMCRKGKMSLFKISYDYINSHGRDQNGKPLGQYFIHGLGHNIGLDVHDPGDSCKPLMPGQPVDGTGILHPRGESRVPSKTTCDHGEARIARSKFPASADEIENNYGRSRQNNTPPMA